MTLKEHIDNIGAAFAASGANNNEILFEQLRLLSLGCDELLYADNPTEGIRDSKNLEPYKTLHSLDGKLSMHYGQRAEAAVDAFLDDWGTLMSTKREDYRELANGLLNAAARNSGHGFDHFQPAELSELVFHLSGYQKGMTVYNPYAGVGSYAGVFSANDNYFGEEFDPAIWGIGVLRCHINGYSSTNYVCGDSLNPQWKRSFDIVVSTPPVGAIGLHEESFSARLVKDAPALLNSGGTMVLVTNGSFLFSIRGESVAKCGLVDMIITLPRNIFYWTSYPPVIVRLKAGRDKAQPIKMVDGSSFCTATGRMLNIINIQELLGAINGSDSRYTSLVSIKELEDNHYRLNPQLYIKIEEESAGGKKMVPLQELGSLVKPSRTKERTPLIIRLGNLSEDPLNLHTTPEEPEEDDHGSYGTLPEDVLLIGGNPSHPKFGYLKSIPEKTIGISSVLYAFIPDNNLVSAQYIAVVLAENGIYSAGSSVIRITLDDLALTRIPLITKSEQKQVISAYAQRHGNPGAKAYRQKARVGIIGNPPIPNEANTNLDKRFVFNKIKDVINWLKAPGNRNKIDALIVNQTSAISNQDLIFLCSEGIPVFILSQDIQGLENAFGNYADQYLPGRCFANGAENDLFSALFLFCDDQNSPEGKIREVYARQLYAAEDLDEKFQFDHFCLRDKLEEILLNKESGKDYVNELRKIRDNCLLTPLIKFGYLPRNKRDFTFGAVVDLLADRVHKNGTILLKTVVPRHQASLLRAITPFLNEGSHVTTPDDKDTQLIAIQIIMSFICLLSGLKSQGYFDGIATEETKKEYVGHIEDFQFKNGQYIVQSLGGDSDYLFAGNVHLDKNRCREINLKVGDVVDIPSAIPEGDPKITDQAKVIFYSKFFDKVQ